jgi:hypothetical protein
LDQGSCEVVGPHFALAEHEWFVVAGQHLHELLDSEKRVFDGALLDQGEEHGGDVRLPWDLVVFLEDLESQEAVILVRLVCLPLQDSVDQSEEFAVHFAKRD